MIWDLKSSRKQNHENCSLKEPGKLIFSWNQRSKVICTLPSGTCSVFLDRILLPILRECIIRKMNCDDICLWNLESQSQVILRINDMFPRLVFKPLGSNYQEALTSLVAGITDLCHHTQIFVLSFLNHKLFCTGKCHGSCRLRIIELQAQVLSYSLSCFSGGVAVVIELKFCSFYTPTIYNSA